MGNWNGDRWLCAGALVGMLAGQAALLKLRPPLGAAIAAVLFFAGAAATSHFGTSFPWAWNLASGIVPAVAFAFCSGSKVSRIGGYIGVPLVELNRLTVLPLPGIEHLVLMAWLAWFITLLGRRA